NGDLMVASATFAFTLQGLFQVLDLETFQSNGIQGLGTNRASQGNGDLVVVSGTTGYVKNVSSGERSRTDFYCDTLLSPDVRVLVVLTENCVTFEGQFDGVVSSRGLACNTINHLTADVSFEPNSRHTYGSVFRQIAENLVGKYRRIVNLQLT